MTEHNSSSKIAVGTLTIGGMHCPACAARVTKVLKALPGVQDAEVNLESRQAKLTYRAGEITPELLQQVLTKEDYTLEGVDL